jgi:fucose permease
MALPGALLPLLLERWILGDARGGLLLFCFFVATTSGALLSRGRMNRSIARGALLTAAGALWLALASRGWGFVAIFAFGLGLGIAMTSTSLYVSQRFPDERRIEMMRLNLLWAAGACAGPWLALGGRTLSNERYSTRPLHTLAGLAIFFAAFAVWVWFAPNDYARPADVAEVQNAGGARALRYLPIALVILVFCSTGVEAATGGWLAAYAHRLGEGVRTTIGAATAFWVGLLGSRAIHSTRAAGRVSERVVLPVSTGLAALGLAVLVGWPGGVASVVGALMAGFGCGPVYPLLLAIVLRRRNTPGIFVVAGVGSAALPLATGAISSGVHSLAAGLCVPLAAAAMMSVISLYRAADLRVAAAESVPHSI